MQEPLVAALAFGAGYAVGAFPVAWLLVRRRHGVDLRDTGAHGALGALAAGGMRTALHTVFLEAIKGAATGVTARALGAPGWMAALAIAGCVAGDAFPPLRRRGGRGIVPLVSGLMIALPAAGFITLVVALAAIAFSRRSPKRAAQITAIAVPVGLVVGTDSILSLIAAVIIVGVLLLRSAIPQTPRLRPAARTTVTLPPAAGS